MREKERECESGRWLSNEIYVSTTVFLDVKLSLKPRFPPRHLLPLLPGTKLAAPKPYPQCSLWVELTWKPPGALLIYEQVAQCSKHMPQHPMRFSGFFSLLFAWLCLFCRFGFFVSGSQFVVQLSTLAARGLCKAYIIQTLMHLCLRKIVVVKAAGRRPLMQRGITTGNSLFPLQQEEIATFKHLNPTRRHPLQSH